MFLVRRKNSSRRIWKANCGLVELKTPKKKQICSLMQVSKSRPRVLLLLVAATYFMPRTLEAEMKEPLAD